MLERGKNLSGASGSLPGAIFQVSVWWESPLSSLASRGPPPYLQFIWIFSYLGFNSLRARECGPHSYSNRASSDVRNLKSQEFSSNGRKLSSCKQRNLVLFRGQGGGLGRRQGEEGRKQADSQVICTWRLSTRWIPRVLTVNLHAEPQELFLGRGSCILKPHQGCRVTPSPPPSPFPPYSPSSLSSFAAPRLYLKLSLPLPLQPCAHRFVGFREGFRGEIRVFPFIIR